MEQGSRRLVTPLLGALLVALYVPTVAWLWERWTLSVWQNAHGLLIPPVVAYLVYEELKLSRGRPSASSAWGFAFVLPALGMLVLDTGMHTQLLAAASLVVMLPGLSLLLLGIERTRQIAFPLAFTLFALPIPLSMTESIHLALRHVATDASALLVPLVGIPVFAEETTLYLARATLVVSDACSGFSTLYAAGAMACLVAYRADTTPRRLLVMAAAAPLAIAANILRVVLLVVIVALTGIEVLDTWIHPASGMLTFALALPIIFWLGQPSQPASAPQKPTGDAASPAGDR